MSAPQMLTREGPSAAEVQIIGVELAYTPPGGGEVELDMFACKHTIPAEPQFYCGGQVRVTLHTSRGDFTLLGQPGQRWAGEQTRHPYGGGPG